jgi:hypothetical protein
MSAVLQARFLGLCEAGKASEIGLFLLRVSAMPGGVDVPGLSLESGRSQIGKTGAVGRPSKWSGRFLSHLQAGLAESQRAKVLIGVSPKSPAYAIAVTQCRRRRL